MYDYDGSLILRLFGGGFLAACICPFSYVLAVPTAPWVESQQTAELHGVFCSLRKAAISGRSHVCVVIVNTAEYHTVQTRKAFGRVWARVRMLCRINRLCLSHSLQV